MDRFEISVFTEGDNGPLEKMSEGTMRLLQRCIQNALSDPGKRADYEKFKEERLESVEK